MALTAGTRLGPYEVIGAIGVGGAFPGIPPFWSPDGDSIAFVTGRRLRRVSLTSGEVQTIADVQGQILGGGWSAEGTIIVGTYQLSKTQGIHRVPASGGQLARSRRLSRTCCFMARQNSWRTDAGFFSSSGHSMSAAATSVRLRSEPKFDFTAPRVLLKTGLTADLPSQRFVTTPDGNRFLFNMLIEADRAATATTLHVVLNWTNRLAR